MNKYNKIKRIPDPLSSKQMGQHILQNQAPVCSRRWIAAASLSLLILILFLPLWSFTDPWPQYSFLSEPVNGLGCPQQPPNRTTPESADPTFYDDPATSYTIDKPEIYWDQKRKHWFKNHPSFSPYQNRLLLITGTQPSACKDPLGDHYLLRFFKNKVDYCRIHGHEIFYNNAVLHHKMGSVWAKLPPLRAAMLAHPQVEWLFWMDADAIFTDMDFKFPLEKYKDYNLVVHGWPDMIYEKKSWLAVNTGAVLIRNCQWSMDLLDIWADMSPRSRDYDAWGKILTSTLSDKMFPHSDEQSSLVYLLLKGERKWRDKIYVENDYCLHGYWLELVTKFDDLGDKYAEMERGMRRHAEAVDGSYAEERGRKAEEGGWRRPFVTHFTGCQPCSGNHNPDYKGDSCKVGMERALNFADNQVLRNYGFVHTEIRNSSRVTPLRF